MRDELFLRYLGKVTGRHAVPRPDSDRCVWHDPRFTSRRSDEYSMIE